MTFIMRRSQCPGTTIRRLDESTEVGGDWDRTQSEFLNTQA